MSSQILPDDLSKAALTVTLNEIPPQPLDTGQDQAQPLSRQDPRKTGTSFRSKSTTVSGEDSQKPNAVSPLPVEVIQRILWTVDANTFASLVLLNRVWYEAAQQKELYAHHLSRCPSYALANTVITGPFRKNDLLRLKSKFAAEVRRNLFEAYLRPRQTLINLISVNASSSAALPGAEAFRFSFSPNGRSVLALSSSRIYVLDATSDIATVRKELKTLRRPLSASITDGGTILAVLSSQYQANIYHLSDTGVKHSQVLVMDHSPRTITLAPEGTVLAAAYEGGVEVFSLAPNALATDRRAVRSEAVDALSFSGDGSMLVGSTQSLDEPSAIVITAPFYTENDLPPREVHSRMWTNQILFPQISSICSHAELLQGHTEGDANWLFTYDHSLMNYRAVRTDDTRAGVAYFLNPPTGRRFSIPAPCTPPTATACGSLVVAGFSGCGLWIYDVPEKLDVSPDMGSVVERHEQRVQRRGPLTSATGHLEPLIAYSPSISGHSSDIEDDSIAAKVDWRESIFVKCQQIRGLEGCTAAKWVEKTEDQEGAFPGKRLILVAPGGVDRFAEELGDGNMPVDGSRISILDFDYSPTVGQDREVTIEVGENEAELLTEEMSDIDIEVAMERRRTVRDRSRGGGKLGLGRSATSAGARNSTGWSQSRLTTIRPSSPLDVDAQIALAEARNQSQQQNTGSLHRSATAAGFNTARYPPRPPLSAQQEEPVTDISQPWYPNGNWYSPPPPYSASPNGAVEDDIPSLSPSTHPGRGQEPDRNSQLFSGAPGHPIAYNLQPSLYQNAYQPQSHITPHAVAGLSVPGQVPGQDGPLTLNNHTQIPPGSSHFAASGSRDAPSTPESLRGRITPSQSTGRSSPLSRKQPPSDHLNKTPPTQPSQKPPASNATTLTGANLQARLNHPIPPTPPVLEQMWSSPNSPHRKTPPKRTDPPATQPPSSLDVQYSVAPPTPNQMADLNRRVSLTTRKPLPVNSSLNQQNDNNRWTNNIPTRRSSGESHTPRAAWGAVGIPGSPSFANPNGLGLSRTNSRGSSNGRVKAYSASTPNLHTIGGTGSMSYVDRPRIGRLDTIESVSSSYGLGEPGARHQGAPAQGSFAGSVVYMRQQQQYTDIYGYPGFGAGQGADVQPQPQPQPQLQPQVHVQAQFQHQPPTHHSRMWAGDDENAPDTTKKRERGRRCIVM
ncbi:hypothetical protein HRR83_005667 [Exophiala dermatitidis]|nr:hypothetical protein HRR83_005667 [Exophiala dermatitidis]